MFLFITHSFILALIVIIWIWFIATKQSLSKWMLLFFYNFVLETFFLLWFIELHEFFFFFYWWILFKHMSISWVKHCQLNFLWLSAWCISLKPRYERFWISLSFSFSFRQWFYFNQNMKWCFLIRMKDKRVLRNNSKNSMFISISHWQINIIWQILIHDLNEIL